MNSRCHVGVAPRAIIVLLADPEHAVAIVLAASLRYLEKFSRERMVALYEDSALKHRPNRAEWTGADANIRTLSAYRVIHHV